MGRSRASAAWRNMSTPRSPSSPRIWLILLAALVIADELSDANEALQQERSRARAAGNPGGEAVEAAASGIRDIAERIESIAARIETA